MEAKGSVDRVWLVVSRLLDLDHPGRSALQILSLTRYQLDDIATLFSSYDARVGRGVCVPTCIE